MSDTSIYWYVFYNVETYEIIEFYSEGIKAPTEGIIEVTVEDIEYAYANQCTHVDLANDSLTFYRVGDIDPSIPPKVFEPLTETPTAEDLLREFKEARAFAVSQITVEVDSMVFDGDEISQDRMSRAIVSLDPLESIPWTLHDNTTTPVTREQLKTALRLSGAAQTSLWVQQEA